MARRKPGVHLTIENRQTIERGLYDGKCKAEIARIIHCDPTTVSKEIMKHRQLCGNVHAYPVECALYKTCRKRSICTPDTPERCPDFQLFECRTRDHSPGVCTQCKKYNSCHYKKYKYSAAQAQHEYITVLKDARSGLDLDVETARVIGPVISEMLNQGRSPYEIIEAHPEFGFSVRTLYTYIDCHAFAVVGIKNIDLRRKVARKINMRKADAKKYKKRTDHTYLNGRTWDDWLVYKKSQDDQNQHISVVEMDTMYNNVTLGPFVQTFRLLDSEIALAVFHTEKTADAMVKGLDYIEKILEKELFEQIFQVLITDRGSEFTAADQLEFREDGSRRTRVFYCNPMSSCSKPHVENKHIEYRYILPKETDLYEIGLISQEQLNIVLSQLNSRILTSVGDGKHTPFAYAKFFYPELVSKMISAGIKEIGTDYVILRPEVLDKSKRMEYYARMGRTLKEYHKNTQAAETRKKKETNACI